MNPTSQALIRQYGNASNFLALYSPYMQAKYCTAVKRLYTGSAPTLQAVANAYGRNIAEAWVEIQLKDISEFAGCKDKLDEDTIAQLARLIVTQWGGYKVTEMMHFFFEFKSGRYGRFYGAVDPMVITEALNAFEGERNKRLAVYAAEQAEEERRAEEERHDRAVKRGVEARAACNMRLREALYLTDRYGFDENDIENIGWLMRLTPESSAARADQQAYYDKHAAVLSHFNL